MEELRDIEQILRITMDVGEITVKVAGGTLGITKKMVTLFKSVLEYETQAGKTNMKKMLLKGGDLRIFELSNDKFKDFKKLSKKYGVAYSVIPKHKDSDIVEVIFHSESTPRMVAIRNKLSEGTVKEVGTILNEMDENEFKELEDFVNSSKHTKSPSENEKTKEISKRVSVINSRDDPSKQGITIDKGLIVEETEDRYKSRIPGSYGKCIWLDKDRCVEVNDGKTIYSLLDKDKDYEIISFDDKDVELIKGKDLIDKHYDKIEAAIEERYKALLSAETKKTRPSKSR